MFDLCVLIMLCILSVVLGPDWWAFAVLLLFLCVHVVRDFKFGYFPFGDNSEAFGWPVFLMCFAIVGGGVLVSRAVIQWGEDNVALGTLLFVAGVVVVAGHTFALATKRNVIYAV